MGQADRVDVADDHHRRAQQACRRGSGQADRTGAGDVNGAARADTGGDRAMVAGGEDVGEAGQVADFLHGLVAIRQFQQVEVGVRYQHVFGLAAGPVAHVDVTIGAAGTGRVDGQAHAGVLLFARAAAAAGNVEGHRDQVADFQVFDIAALLDHFAGDLMTEHQPGLGGGAAAHHVLVGAADIGGDHAQDDAVLDLPATGVLHFGIVDFLYFDFAVAEIHDTTITRHAFTSLLFLWNRVAQAGSALSARVADAVFALWVRALSGASPLPHLKVFTNQHVGGGLLPIASVRAPPSDWRSKTPAAQCDTPPPGPESAPRYRAPWRSNPRGNDCDPPPPRPGR